MKKSLFILIPALSLVFFVASCKKDDPVAPAIISPVGSWIGTGQYGTGPGVSTYVFTLNFKTNGSVDIVGNNSTGVDNATGTWQQVQDSVKATYIYAGSSATYTLAGKYSNNSASLSGTIGLGTAASGVGLFSITKQ